MLVVISSGVYMFYSFKGIFVISFDYILFFPNFLKTIFSKMPAKKSNLNNRDCAHRHCISTNQTMTTNVARIWTGSRRQQTSRTLTSASFFRIFFRYELLYAIKDYNRSNGPYISILSGHEITQWTIGQVLFIRKSFFVTSSHPARTFAIPSGWWMIKTYYYVWDANLFRAYNWCHLAQLKFAITPPLDVTLKQQLQHNVRCVLRSSCWCQYLTITKTSILLAVLKNMW